MSDPTMIKLLEQVAAKAEAYAFKTVAQSLRHTSDEQHIAAHTVKLHAAYLAGAMAGIECAVKVLGAPKR
jgi:hypothetical protein